MDFKVTENQSPLNTGKNQSIYKPELCTLFIPAKVNGIEAAAITKLIGLFLRFGVLDL
jgi:hypothetical protein